MSVFTDEREADKAVINSLLKEINRLKGITMSKIIKSASGKFYRVHSYEELSAQDVANEAARLQDELNYLQDTLSAPAPEQPAQPEAPSEAAQPEAPAPSVPAAVEAPTQPEQPVAPVDTATEAPATDANADAGQPDPNAVTLQ